MMELDELNGKDFWKRYADEDEEQKIEEEGVEEEEEEEENPDQSSPKSQTPEQQQPFHTQPFPYFSNSQQQQLQQDIQLHQQQFYARLAQQQQQQQLQQTQQTLPPAKKRSYFSSSSPPSSTFAEQNLQHAQQPNLGERSSIRQTTSRLGMRNTGGGEIIEVQGGHIVRSTGRKDRHSKVCTAKGPRDRRVRLSAHTAIQFYDVQDRLGYDRPSKAVDWLIKKAKAAIDNLAELPPWHPTATTNVQTPTTTTNASSQQEQMVHGHVANSMEDDNGYTIQHKQHERVGNENNASFLPASMDSDSIADTIKTFFPVGATAEPTSGTGMQFYPTDLLSRSRNSSQNTQDLRLSLQSFQDSQFLQSHHHHQQHPGQTHQAVFSGNQLGFDTSSGGEGWSDQQSEIHRYQRFMAWNTAGGDTAGGSGGGSGGSGFMFNSLPPPPLSQPSLQQFFGHSGQYFTQRGPLQSSNTSSVRAWIDQPIANHHQTLSDHSSTLTGIGHFQTPSAFSGFQFPARIRGDNEEQDGNHNNSSSAYSDSRH